MTYKTTVNVTIQLSGGRALTSCIIATDAILRGNTMEFLLLFLPLNMAATSLKACPLLDRSLA